MEIPHALPLDEVRARLGRATAKLERDYGAACSWDGDGRLIVARKGLTARVTLEGAHLRIHVELGLLLGPLAGSIRAGITKQLTGLLAEPVGP